MGVTCFDGRNVRRKSEIAVFTDKNDIYGNNALSQNNQLSEQKIPTIQQPQSYPNYPQQNIFNQNSSNNAQNIYPNIDNAQFTVRNNELLSNHNTQNILDKLRKMYPNNYNQENSNNNFNNNTNDNMYSNQNKNINPFYKQNCIYDTFKNDNNGYNNPPNINYSNFNTNKNQSKNNNLESQIDLPSEEEVNKKKFL